MLGVPMVHFLTLQDNPGFLICCYAFCAPDPDSYTSGLTVYTLADSRNSIMNEGKWPFLNPLHINQFWNHGAKECILFR